MRNFYRVPMELRWGVILLPWIASAGAILATKFSLMRGAGFHEAAPFLGGTGLISVFDTFALFRSDLLLLFFVVPLIILLLTVRMARRSAFYLSASFSAALALLTALQAHVWKLTGSFTTFRLTYGLLAWEMASRDASFLAIHTQVWVAFGTLLFLTAIFAFIVHQLIANALTSRHVVFGECAALACIAAAIPLGLIAWIPRIPPGPWTSPLLGNAVYSFFFEDMARSSRIRQLQAYGTDRLMEMYRSSALAPPTQPSSYFGKAADANIVIFTMESMSAEVVDPASDDLADMPNLRQLREHSFVLARHYTSFPQTDYATFSMLTSLYAQCVIQCNPSELTQTRGPRLPTLMRTLDAAGYRTAFYGFVWQIPSQRDDLMLASLGFSELRPPAIDPEKDRAGLTTFYGPADYTAGHDLQSLNYLCHDIHEWSSNHQHFAAMYFPEVSHDPYRGADAGTEASALRRGRALAKLEDGWLGQIVQQLRDDGVLKKTIIVVTGDHGMRFSATLPDGSHPLTADRKLDDRVMRVPMLIYAPQALKSAVRINYPTSHIDLSPTLLDLLGLSGAPLHAQGSPVTEQRLANRRIYLPMGTYGASGFYENGAYFMITSDGRVYKNSTMRFSERDILPYGSAEGSEARHIESEHEATQAALLSNLLNVHY
ncbi:LTA synthase family protein [Occallatibacter riparius]|uniref:Sulfatase-like hydrolase/transferase n=1 Tax=Occallatibacter riparius TaxID=1002689 RepID=A0A9J7BM78_9BACT|nr:sulfatase-like hydrolase/transferase [Occallatibacter riparius]UWZ83988.1 sulfatase-like hydrolase/transferase [Occallatibacter riparius]